jgi:hypothetical protein
MSATAAPFGLRPVYHPTGNVRLDQYTIAAAYTTAIFKGDPVILNANGTVTVGTASAALLGVFQGCEYLDSTGKPNYSNFWPGTASCTEINCYVCTDLETVYEVQAGVQNTPLTITVIGDESDLNTYAAGSTSTGMSICSILMTTLAGAGNQKQWRIIGVAPYPDNAIGDLYPIFRVTLANSQFRVPTTAI